MKKLWWIPALALISCASQLADGSKLDITNRTVNVPQAAQFCLDNPEDEVCTR